MRYLIFISLRTIGTCVVIQIRIGKLCKCCADKGKRQK